MALELLQGGDGASGKGPDAWFVCHVALNSPFPCAFSYSANHDKAFLILKMIPYPTYAVIISFLSMSCQI